MDDLIVSDVAKSTLPKQCVPPGGKMRIGIATIFPDMPSFRRKPIDLVIDVRSRLEYWLGHLDGATCIPVDKLADTIPKRANVNADTRILVYCASGARSAAAASVLKSLGYRRVTDGGGIGEARTNYES